MLYISDVLDDGRYCVKDAVTKKVEYKSIEQINLEKQEIWGIRKGKQGVYDLHSVCYDKAKDYVFNNAGSYIEDIDVFRICIDCKNKPVVIVPDLYYLEAGYEVRLRNIGAVQVLVFEDGTGHIGECTGYTPVNNIHTVILPDSVRYIDDYAFCNWGSLRKIYLSDNIESIEDNSFTECNNLSEVVISDGTYVKTISDMQSCLGDINADLERVFATTKIKG